MKNLFRNRTFFGIQLAVVFASSLAFSQTSGKIEYDIEIKGLTPELEKGAAMLFDSKMTVAFADSNVRQDYKMGDVSTKTTVLSKTYNQAIFYENGLNGKIAIVGTNDDIASMAKVDTNIAVTFTDETKLILGFTCKKAILKFTSGENAEYWYTTEFPVEFPKSNFFNPKIPGIPLEFSTSANGFFMRFKCINYSDTVEHADVYFKPIVSRDYTVIDFKSYMAYLELEKIEQAKKLEKEAEIRKQNELKKD